MRPSSLGGAAYCVALCLSLCPSVCPSVPLLFLFTFFTVEPSYERTSKIEKLLFSLMGQRHVCAFWHAQRAAYRTAISAAQTCWLHFALSNAAPSWLTNGILKNINDNNVYNCCHWTACRGLQCVVDDWLRWPLHWRLVSYCMKLENSTTGCSRLAKNWLSTMMRIVNGKNMSCMARLDQEQQSANSIITKRSLHLFITLLLCKLHFWFVFIAVSVLMLLI